MKKQKAGKVGFVSLCVLVAAWFVFRFPLLQWHGMKEWPFDLLVLGVFVIVICMIQDSKIVPVFTAAGYIIGFFAGLLFHSDSYDYGGGEINNMWIIWTGSYIAAIVAGVLIEILCGKQLGRVEKLSLELDGSSLDCVRFGTGDKTLVMIPGLSFQYVRNAALPLAWMYRTFAKEYTVYVLDKKNVVPAGYTIRDLANDTARVMERLNICDADVFGVSQGGMIAMYLAIDYPKLVRKLVLGVTAARSNEVMRNAVGGWIQMAERGEYETIVSDMLGKIYSPNYIKKYGRLFPIIAKFGKPRDFSRFINLAEACLSCDAYTELEKIKCPAFVIGGKLDNVATGTASEEIARKLNCSIYMYETLGHAAYDEAGDFNLRVRRFLRG